MEKSDKLDSMPIRPKQNRDNKDTKKEPLRGGQQTEHTPTPWSYTGTSDWATIYQIGTHEHVAGMMNKNNPKADAEFIVRAVNSYEALLEEAKEAANDLLSLSAEEAKPLAIRASLNRLMRAIAKAEGK